MPLERRGDVAGLAADAVRQHRAEAARCGLAPRASACARDFEHQERAERAERQAAGCGLALPDRRELVLQGEAAELVEHQQVRALGVVAPPTSAMSLWPASMRASAMRTASTPAASSPMKVRDEPVTPCTIEMLPASRLESCARNSVGRRSLISRSLRKASGFVGRRQAGQDRGVDRDVALAAAGRDDHVRARQEFGVAFDAGAVEREPRRIGADALPRLHLALVALFRDLLVEIERRERWTM